MDGKQTSDDEMRDGIRRLGKEGIFAEPAGASTVWAAKHLAESGAIRPDETVVLLVTATGLKQPEAAPLPELPRQARRKKARQTSKAALQ